MVKVSMGNQFVAVNQVTSYSFMDIFSKKCPQETTLGDFQSTNWCFFHTFASCPDEGGRHPTKSPVEPMTGSENFMAYEIIPTNKGGRMAPSPIYGCFQK